MYLVKYVLCAAVFAASLLIVTRTCASTRLSTPRGKLARALLTLLLFAFVAVIWYYATVKNFDFKWFVTTVRVVSAAAFVLLLPDVWRDGKEPEESAAPAAGEAEPAPTPAEDEEEKEEK